MTYSEQVHAVQSLAQQIGYGELMSIASALWDREWQRRGVQSAYLLPVHISFVRKRFRDTALSKHLQEYDRVVTVLDL